MRGESPSVGNSPLGSGFPIRHTMQASFSVYCSKLSFRLERSILRTLHSGAYVICRLYIVAVSRRCDWYEGISWPCLARSSWFVLVWFREVHMVPRPPHLATYSQYIGSFPLLVIWKGC